MEFFCESCQQLLTINNSNKNTPTLMFDKVLNTPLLHIAQLFTHISKLLYIYTYAYYILINNLIKLTCKSNSKNVRSRHNVKLCKGCRFRRMLHTDHVEY